MDIPDALWRQTAPDALPAERLSGARHCDVAVIGGGFTGLRAALELAEAGTDVAVFEAGDVGFGASGRSGGQVNPMLPVARPDDLRRAVGKTYFERMAQTALGSADDLFDFIRKYQIQCDARQHGWVRADHCATARKVARRNADLWNAFGAGFEFLDGEEVTRLTGAYGYRTATVSPRAFSFSATARAAGSNASMISSYSSSSSSPSLSPFAPNGSEPHGFGVADQELGALAVIGTHCDADPAGHAQLGFL